MSNMCHRNIQWHSLGKLYKSIKGLYYGFNSRGLLFEKNVGKRKENIFSYPLYQCEYERYLTRDYSIICTFFSYIIVLWLYSIIRFRHDPSSNNSFTLFQDRRKTRQNLQSIRHHNIWTRKRLSESQPELSDFESHIRKSRK